MSWLRGVAGVKNIHRGGVPRFKVILGGAGGVTATSMTSLVKANFDLVML